MGDVFEKNSQSVCIDILNMIGNQNVNVELDEKSKNSLYVFLTNTIYISEKIKKNKNKDEQNKSRVLIIAHECAHSIQSKLFQLLNFVLANMEIILFALLVVLKIFTKYDMHILKTIYISTLMICIFIRLYLELDATIKSVNILSNYFLKNNINKEEVIKYKKYYKGELLKTLPAFIAYLFFFKIIRLIIAIML